MPGLNRKRSIAKHDDQMQRPLKDTSTPSLAIFACRNFTILLTIKAKTITLSIIAICGKSWPKSAGHGSLKAPTLAGTGKPYKTPLAEEITISATTGINQASMAEI